MSLFERIRQFFKSIFGNKEEDVLQPLVLTEATQEEIESEEFKIERINIAKRTLMTKLYSLEQSVTFFQTEFPEDYKRYMEKINNIREEYNKALEGLGNELTFDIDPELDTTKLKEVLQLENEVKVFLETQVKFDIISKSLQRLIIKLNILYNTSIYHCKEEDKMKVIAQLERARKTVTNVSRDFKNCHYIVNNAQLKEGIVTLLSFIDYEIFKTSIRNSYSEPNDLIEDMIMVKEFTNFDYVKAFENFIRDELSDLKEMIPLISYEDCRDMLEKKLKKLSTSFAYSDDVENKIFDTSFWNSLFEIESSLLELLKTSGASKDVAKIGIIDRMNISIDKSEVLVMPTTNAYLALTNVFSKTQDEKVLLLMKILKNLSKDVTYKEIYFLILLFDGLDVILNNPNDLNRQLEKYIAKYPYSKSTINSKKDQLIMSSNKEYVAVFPINQYENNILNTLTRLKIDFVIDKDYVWINAFYFNGLDNVLNAFTENTIKLVNNDTTGGNNNA